MAIERAAEERSLHRERKSSSQHVIATVIEVADVRSESAIKSFGSTDVRCRPVSEIRRITSDPLGRTAVPTSKKF
jgi:hypothetical protein